MPKTINAELASWQGETIIGASGDVYRIDDATADNLDVRVWVWNPDTRDLDDLYTAAGATPSSRTEALAVIEEHTMRALAAQEPAAPATGVIWDGLTGEGASGVTYTIDEQAGPAFRTHTGSGDAIYYLETPANYPGTKKAAKRVAEQHEKQVTAERAAKQVELRNAAAKTDRHFAAVVNAVESIGDTTSKQVVLAALDEYREDAFDRKIHEYWVFPGVPINKFSEGCGNDTALNLAERAAADWAEETKDQATVVSVRSERHQDGSRWSPALYFQWRGVERVSEKHLRRNKPTERFDD